MSNVPVKPEQIRIVEAGQMKGLFSRPQFIPVEVKTTKYGTLKFTVRPMNNETYAKMGLVMDGKGIDMKDTSDMSGLRVFSGMYYPAMKVVFPYCCITPAVIDGVSTDPNTLNIAEIPLDVCLELLHQIMLNSGISADEDEDRKN